MGMRLEPWDTLISRNLEKEEKPAKETGNEGQQKI
jgi:hypothetical protein